jgi:hypothetical protein
VLTLAKSALLPISKLQLLCSWYFFAGRAPKTVKLFINQPQTLDFDAAEQRKPVQEFVYVNSSVLGYIVHVIGN